MRMLGGWNWDPETPPIAQQKQNAAPELAEELRSSQGARIVCGSA